MKKYLLILFFSIISFSNFLSTSFNARIHEISGNREKVYLLKYSPNFIEVKVEFPNTNKGEIYTYKNGEKYIYFPKLKQTVEQSISNSDNDLFKMLNEMKKINKSCTKNNKTYYVKNGKIEKISTKTYTVNFEYVNEKPRKITIVSGKDHVEFLWTY